MPLLWSYSTNYNTFATALEVLQFELLDNSNQASKPFPYLNNPAQIDSSYLKGFGCVPILGLSWIAKLCTLFAVQAPNLCRFD